MTILFQSNEAIMIKPYVMTEHAKERKKEFFPRVNLVKDFDTVTSCTSDEIYQLKNTKAYKQVKESKKSSICFFKTKMGMYLVVDKKPNGIERTINFIITIIDLKKNEVSFIDNDFKKVAIKSAYELEQQNKHLSSHLRVIKDLNQNASLRGFSFHENDFISNKTKEIKFNGNKLIQQRSSLMGARAGLLRGMSSGSNLNNLMINALKSGKDTYKKQTKKEGKEGLRTKALTNGNAKAWFLSEYSKYLKSLSEGFKRLISKGEMLSKSDLDVGFNIYEKWLEEKGTSKEFDAQLKKLIHQLVLSDVLCLKLSIELNEEIYSAYLRKTLSFVNDLKNDGVQFNDEDIAFLNEIKEKIDASGRLCLEGELLKEDLVA